MCEVELPVPSIDKQKKIVKEYNVINDRIKLNENTNQKLEETAQAIYKNWFVDFEFPNAEGKPYKSSGGEMVFFDELDMEIPECWSSTTYEHVMNFTTGKLNSNAAVIDGKFPFFTCSAETFKTNTYSFDTEAVLLAGNNASAIYPLKFFKGKFDAYQRTYIISTDDNRLSNQQIYFTVKNELENFKGISSGTATKFLTMQILNNLNIILADEKTSRKFHTIIKEFFNLIALNFKELEKLHEFKEILLSKMATIEG
jgi:type I restriction enzyme S subunit